MKHLLYKLSSPGWVKEFPTEYDARVELFKHICMLCITGEESEFCLPIDMNSSINEMLCTSCGCEYDYEVVERVSEFDYEEVCDIEIKG